MILNQKVDTLSLNYVLNIETMITQKLQHITRYKCLLTVKTITR